MLLKDKIALVTGAGNPEGIGFSVAQTFVAEGASVVVVDRNERAVDQSVKALGERAVGVAADLRDEAACRRVFDVTRERFGRLDVLVNNAGITQPRKFTEITAADYDAIMDINLRGTVMMTQGALGMMESGASIICIASIAGQRGGGLMGGAHYAASKGAVLSLVKSVAREISPDGIRINAVNPGVIMSSMTRDFYDDVQTARVLPQIPIGRFGAPQDVANTCLFLASDLSSYMTGSAVDVNGGMHMN